MGALIAIAGLVVLVIVLVVKLKQKGGTVVQPPVQPPEPVTNVPVVTIAVINKATVPLGDYSLEQLVAAAQKAVDTIFAPIWAAPCKLVISQDFIPGAYAMLLVDDADQAGALGYHDWTPDGGALAYIFVKTTQDAGEEVSVTFTHELFEMLVDPFVNLTASKLQNFDGLFYAYEVADAIEEYSFAIDGVPISDFVFPAWFEDGNKQGPFDYLGKAKRPYHITPGGYMPVYNPQQGWTQIFGSTEKQSRFARESGQPQINGWYAREGHRSDLRKRLSEAQGSRPL